MSVFKMANGSPARLRYRSAPETQHRNNRNIQRTLPRTMPVSNNLRGSMIFAQHRLQSGRVQPIGKMRNVKRNGKWVKLMRNGGLSA